MAKTARISDSHHGVCNHGYDCCPHSVSGIIINGSNNVNNNSGIARDGDNVTHDCPHCGTGKISSTSNVKVNGKSIATIGDTVIYPGGSGIIDSGSSNTNINKR